MLFYFIEIIPLEQDELIYNQTGVKCLTICPGKTDTTLLSTFHAKENLLFCRKESQPSDYQTQRSVSEISQYKKKNTRDNTCSVICSPSVVGECLVKAILDGENGSVWIANEGRAYKMEFPENQFLNLKESKQVK